MCGSLLAIVFSNNRTRLSLCMLGPTGMFGGGYSLYYPCGLGESNAWWPFLYSGTRTDISRLISWHWTMYTFLGTSWHGLAPNCQMYEVFKTLLASTLLSTYKEDGMSTISLWRLAFLFPFRYCDLVFPTFVSWVHIFNMHTLGFPSFTICDTWFKEQGTHVPRVEDLKVQVWAYEELATPPFRHCALGHCLHSVLGEWLVVIIVHGYLSQDPTMRQSHCIPDHCSSSCQSPRSLEEPEELAGDWVAGTICWTEEQPFGETNPCLAGVASTLFLMDFQFTPLRQLSILFIFSCVPQCWIVVCGNLTANRLPAMMRSTVMRKWKQDALIQQMLSFEKHHGSLCITNWHLLCCIFNFIISFL